MTKPSTLKTFHKGIIIFRILEVNNSQGNRKHLFATRIMVMNNSREGTRWRSLGDLSTTRVPTSRVASTTTKAFHKLNAMTLLAYPWKSSPSQSSHVKVPSSNPLGINMVAFHSPKRKAPYLTPRLGCMKLMEITSAAKRVLLLYLTIWREPQHRDSRSAGASSFPEIEPTEARNSFANNNTERLVVERSH